MNPIKKRIYFDSEGYVILAIDLYGETTVEKDIADFKALSERNRDTFDVLELPFGAYAQDFAEARLIGVDLEKKIPLFAYPDPENPGQEITPPIPLSEEVKTLKNELAAVQGAVDFIILNY